LAVFIVNRKANWDQMSYENRFPRILGTLYRMEEEARQRGEPDWIRSIDLANRILTEETRKKRQGENPLLAMKVTLRRGLKDYLEDGLVEQREQRGPYRLTLKGRIWCQTHGDLIDPNLQYDEARLTSSLVMSFAMAPTGSPAYRERVNETKVKLGALAEKFMEKALEIDPTNRVIILRVDETQEKKAKQA
jgi:hypothetical protein